jgi:hypothetical protein
MRLGLLFVLVVWCAPCRLALADDGCKPDQGAYGIVKGVVTGLLNAAVPGVGTGLANVPSSCFQAAPPPKPVWQLWQKDHPDHFYTVNCDEALKAVADYGYVFDFKTPVFLLAQQGGPGDKAFYRFFDGVSRHFYSTDSNAENAPGYREHPEGAIGFLFGSPGPNRLPLYRLNQPSNGDHLYVTDLDTANAVVSKFHYVSEGFVGYVEAPSTETCTSP